MTTVAIGDIHGMYDMLDRLLVEINAFAIRERKVGHPKLVFLGDYVDRGPDSRRVVRRVRALQDRGAICLRGNHEEMMARYKEGWCNRQNFLFNGGTQTLASYAGYAEEFEDDYCWMASLPTSYEDELRVFVHAGLKPGQPLAHQTDETKMWARQEFLKSLDAFPKYVVHGHTPTFPLSGHPWSPEVLDNRCNLDTGACYGGSLTAAFFDDDEATPFHIISVSQGENEMVLSAKHKALGA
jgi:serine/threonine protein phosphatase 1